MSQFVLINHIKVQNANAVAGLTWGFPSITHFLGFVHNLSRKLANEKKYHEITLSGCGVIAHEHHVHTYKSNYERRFSQSRNQPCLYGIAAAKKSEPPPIIEEGKMNLTVSLLIECDGNLGNRADGMQQWLKNACLLQRLAGGTILDIADISFFAPEDNRDVRIIARRLLPGFVLRDRSQYLEEHYQGLQENEPESELLDAWLDFSAMKYKARPKSDLVSRHLRTLVKKEPDNKKIIHLGGVWGQHLEAPYDESMVPSELKDYFASLEGKRYSKLLKQWQDYCCPHDKIDADWEYVKKPKPGYLVPIMTGYKAISRVYKNTEVSNTRDSETDVCFVESVHSVGEWQSAHRIKTIEQLQACVWHYHYEKNWYLCKQGESTTELTNLANTQGDNLEETIFD